MIRRRGTPAGDCFGISGEGPEACLSLSLAERLDAARFLEYVIALC